MDFKKYLPHLGAIVALLLVSAVFFAPNAFEGKVLAQPDNDKALGMQTEINEYLKKDGKAPLWTNSTFSGMPTYQIQSIIKGNVTQYIGKAVFLWGDYTSVWSQIFAAMLCMYFLLIVLKLDWKQALFGAVAFGITTYNVDLLEAGHTTKMRALALAPGVFAGAILLYNKRLLAGAAVSALFVALQVNANHVQITYYTMLLAGIYVLAQLLQSIRSGETLNWAKATGILALTIALGVGCNTSRLWPTLEYSQETIRGRSELADKSAKGSGLDIDYLFGWSYGVGESLTLLVPRAYGGGAGEAISGTEFFDMVSKGANAAQKKQIARQIASSYYWGDQPFVGTAIYLGAIVCFLFFLGALLVPGSTKWWLIAAALFSLSLAWGKNFFLNFILYDYFPFFNKFRAVSMALGLTQLCAVVLGAMSLKYVFDEGIDLQKRQRALYISLGITTLFCLIAAFMGAGPGPNDKGLIDQLKAPELASILISDREALARSDAFRSIGFILAAFAMIWLALRGTLKPMLAIPVIIVLSLADNWSVCHRTLSDEKYKTRREASKSVPEEDFDKQIKQDKDIHYRVLDLSRGGLTGNAYTSYYHKSMSGYHAAKLQLYQEVIDTFLTGALGQNLHIVGMLNGKYIVTQKKDVVPNALACGNAWFVKELELVGSPEAEIGRLHTINPKEKAVVQQKYAADLQGFNIQPDSTASIKLVKYHPDKMEYEYSAQTDQIALFSEVYYPPAKGWKCYLNGQEVTPFFKANYVIRGMKLPAGQNMKLEMRFEPRSYYTGETIALICSVLVLGLLVLYAGLFFKSRKQA